MKIEISLDHTHFLTQKINEETKNKGTAFPFGFVIKNDTGKIIAGCNGSVVFGAIYTDQLWVHKDYRRLGLGRKLMEHVHNYALQQGCTMATIATMSFQGAQTFYEKLGYIVDFKRFGYTQNSSCIFLKRSL